MSDVSMGKSPHMIFPIECFSSGLKRPRMGMEDRFEKSHRRLYYTYSRRWLPGVRGLSASAHLANNKHNMWRGHGEKQSRKGYGRKRLESSHLFIEGGQKRV